MPHPTVRRVVAIDPGSIQTGWAVVDASGNRCTLIACGHIRAGRAPLSERLEKIYADIQALCGEHAPGEAAIEALFHHRNPDSALKLGHARAAALLALRHADLPVTEYEPSVVKKSVTGTGSATKEQVRAMAERLVRRPIGGSLDASDAVAIALCHVHQHPALARRPL